MATINAPSLRNRVYNGTSGNLSKEFGTAVFSGHAAGTVSHVLKMDAGTQFFGLKAFAGALGALTGMTVGIHYPEGDGTDDPGYFGTVADTSVATTLTWETTPVTFNERVVITVTVTGAAGTGSVNVVPEYAYKGAL